MNILIVGLGSMGKRRARLIRILGAHTIAGVDNTEDRRAEAGALGIKTYPHLPEALEAEQFDAAFVCTAPLTHALIIDQLLDANIPVFTELNLVPDGYEGLMAKAAERGLTLFLSSTMMYRGETRFIASQVKEFAKPLNYIYHIGQYLPDWHPWESYKDFFVGDPRTGGVREILGIDLPWLFSAFGPVQSAHVEKDKISDLEIAYPDSWFITLRHVSGHKGFLAADVVSPKSVRNFEMFGDGMHLFWEGNPKTLSMYDRETKQNLPVETITNLIQDTRYSDNIVENAYIEEIQNFFGVLAGTEQPLWSFEQDLEVIRLMEQLECIESGNCKDNAP